MINRLNQYSARLPTLGDSKGEEAFFHLASDMKETTGNEPSGVAIEGAIKVCSSLDIEPSGNFTSVTRQGTSLEVQNDTMLSRFAYYLVLMNTSSKKTKVAHVQAHLAELMTKIIDMEVDKGDVKRWVIRERVREGQKTMASQAGRVGVYDFSRFHNAGHRGMYEKQANKLKEYRRLGKNDDLYDYMGAPELGANLYRITETEKRLSGYEIKGQGNAEAVHFLVGKNTRERVRTRIDSGPENWPKEKPLTQVEETLRRIHKVFSDCA